MTEIEARVLRTVLEWAKASAEFQGLMLKWDTDHDHNPIEIRAANDRLNRAWDAFNSTRSDYLTSMQVPS